MMAEPFPKDRQLARGERRYSRKIASPKQWQAIIAAKGDVCIMCDLMLVVKLPVEYHHLVPRSMGGDDTPENIVPLCAPHHRGVTAKWPNALTALAESLTDAEYTYVIGKLGEGAMGRLFGV
jgi:HNH endonuclease